MFGPASIPAGCTYRPVPFWEDRPLITPRSIFAHTMSASVRTTVQSAWNHALRAPHKNTLPHYALGLDEQDGCAKFLPSNRRGIATATVTSSDDVRWPKLTAAQQASILANGDRSISWWSLAIETADTGYIADPAISAFTDYQLEMLTRIYVHECAGWNIPAVKLPEWHSSGCATHTEPHNYPFTTLYIKTCPGSKKKAQFWSEVLPEVQRRLTPAPIPVPVPTPIPVPSPPSPEDSPMWLVAKVKDGPHVAARTAQSGIMTLHSEVPLRYVFACGGGFAFDLGTSRIITLDEWGGVPAKFSYAECVAFMGAKS